MLTIRAAQLEQLRAAFLNTFVDDMLRRLAIAWPAQVAAYDETSLRALVRDSVKEAASYGLTNARDVAGYIEIALILGERFHDGEAFAAKTILSDAALKPSEKIERLRRYCRIAMSSDRRA